LNDKIESMKNNIPPQNLMLEREMNLGLPAVRLSQDRQWLMWELPELDPEDLVGPDSWRTPTPPETSGALNAVVGIVRSDDDSDSVVSRRVLNVARRYGPLYLCGHGRPMNHASQGSPPELLRNCVLETVLSEKGSEQLAHWRRFASEVRDLLEFSQLLSSARTFGGELKNHPLGQEVMRYYGNIFISEVPGGREAGPTPTDRRDRTKGYVAPVELENAHAFIELKVSDLIEEARIMPKVQWSTNKSRFDFGYEPGVLGLYGVVVLQLAMGMGGSDRWMNCDGCQAFYFRGRDRKMPSSAQLNFCDQCTTNDGIKRQAQRANKRRKSDGQ
jgi:hypothetical protein